MLQEFSSDGVRIAFIDVAPEGSDLGEPILLIHGFASTHRINWVNPRWVDTLSKAGRRVIAFDNRGHGRSEKLYDPAAYHSTAMARDAANLLDQTLQEEKKTDALLTKLADAAVNRKAA